MAPPQLTVGRRYNPAAYAYSSASPKVAKAVQAKGYQPYNPAAYVPGGAPANVASAIQTLGGGPGIFVTPVKPTKAPATVRVDNPVDTVGTDSIRTDVPSVTKPFVAPDNPYGDTAPDVAALIAGDYEVQDAEGAMASRMKAIRDAFQANVRRALIDLGVGDTSQLGKFGSYIDQDTITHAIGNKYSANAQINLAKQKQEAQTAAALAARGGLASGQYSKSMGDINAQAEQDRYSALQDFLSSAETGLGGIANEQYTQDQAIARARANAAARAADYDLGWRNWKAQADLLRAQQAAAVVPGAESVPYVGPGTVYPGDTGNPNWPENEWEAIVGPDWVRPLSAPQPVVRPKAPAYNPAAYAYSSASPKVAKAIQAKGKKK